MLQIFAIALAVALSIGSSSMYAADPPEGGGGTGFNAAEKPANQGGSNAIDPPDNQGGGNAIDPPDNQGGG